jgi:GTP cyclohydrolase I
LNNLTNLPDIQSSKSNISIPIKQVGVENIIVPFNLELKKGGFHKLTARVSIRTNLNKNIKGISMSRLLLTLKPYLELPLKNKLIKLILQDIQNNLETNESYIKFEFLLPILKKSIKSYNSFPLYYKCRFEGQLFTNNYFKFYQGIKIQYASYCPCSVELCKHLNEHDNIGFPHNQRSYADILIEGKKSRYIWLEDIILNIENNIKTLPYPIIKRIDEQEIAKIAANNPMFVEDAIRIISKTLNDIDDIYDWIVKCIHEESIHTSEAIAINWKGIKEGFNGDRYI